jgi:hypothetical protein
MGNAERNGIMRAVADQRAVFIVKLGDEVLGILARFSFGIAHDHMHAQAIVERAVILAPPPR